MSTEMALDFCIRIERGESTKLFVLGDWHSDHID